MFKVSEMEKVVQKNKLLGRGPGSGRGKNSGKGHKGQNKRAGKRPVTFVGGNKSLVRRTPKLKGFKAYDRKNSIEINTDILIPKFEKGSTVSMASLLEKGFIGDKIKKVRIIKGYLAIENLDFVDDAKIHLTKGVKSVISK